jgi:hypothetical protein
MGSETSTAATSRTSHRALAGQALERHILLSDGILHAARNAPGVYGVRDAVGARSAGWTVYLKQNEKGVRCGTSPGALAVTAGAESGYGSAGLDPDKCSPERVVPGDLSRFFSR